jgi:hypothetical protein
VRVQNTVRNACRSTGQPATTLVRSAGGSRCAPGLSPTERQPRP